MPMNVTTPKSKILKYFDERIQTINRLIVRSLCYVGEQCVNTARSSHTYRDQTGNLTSSIGYAVSCDGSLVNISSFQVERNGSEGSKEGSEYVREIIAKYPNDIVLVICAGMNYAVYVSDKGYDVLDGAETLADRLVPNMLKKLGIGV